MRKLMLLTAILTLAAVPAAAYTTAGDFMGSFADLDALTPDVTSLGAGVYQVSGTIYIETNAMLGVQADEEIRFDPGCGIVILFDTVTTNQGMLMSTGGPDAVPLLTSSQAVPAPGDWNGIEQRGPNNFAQYVEIAYADVGYRFASRLDIGGLPSLAYYDIHDCNIATSWSNAGVDFGFFQIPPTTV